MIHTIYDIETGAIEGTIRSDNSDSIVASLAEGQAVVEGHFSALTHYIGASGAAEEYPEIAPSVFHRFDRVQMQWVDPRTPSQVEIDLISRRAAASLTKPQFIIASMSVGLLTPAEAAEAANGLIPSSFQPAFEGLTPQQQDYARVLWPAATVIERMDPLVLAVAQYLSISDQTLDAIFGLVEYEP